MKHFARVAALGLLAIAIKAPAAAADDITVLSAGAMRSAVQEIAASYQKSSGEQLTMIFGTAGDVEQRVRSGDKVYNVAIATKPRLEELEKAGKIVAGSIVVIGRSPIALAVRKGQPKPDISTVEAFKKTLLAAASIAYTDPASGGTSGIHMAQVIRDLGIADAVQAKTKLITGQPGAPPAVGEAIAHGAAEIGLQPISELTGVPGIEIVGTIPDALQTPALTYAAGLVAGTGDTPSSTEFVKFLTSEAAANVVKSKGLIPGDGR